MVLFLKPSLFLKIKPQVCTLAYKALLICPLQPLLILVSLIQLYFSSSSTSSTFLPQGLCTSCFLCLKGSLYTGCLQRWFLPILDVLVEILLPHKTLFVTSPGSFHCFFSLITQLFPCPFIDWLVCCLPLPNKRKASQRQRPFLTVHHFILCIMQGTKWALNKYFRKSIYIEWIDWWTMLSKVIIFIICDWTQM